MDFLLFIHINIYMLLLFHFHSPRFNNSDYLVRNLRKYSSCKFPSFYSPRLRILLRLISAITRGQNWLPCLKWGDCRISLRFENRLNFSIIPRKLSMFYRSFSNRSTCAWRRSKIVSINPYVWLWFSFTFRQMSPFEGILDAISTDATAWGEFIASADCHTATVPTNFDSRLPPVARVGGKGFF